MDLMKAGLLGGAALLLGGAVLLQDRSNRRKAERLLKKRPALGAEAFGRQHFGETEGRAALAAKVREALARHVPFSLDGLAPDDAFTEGLRMDQIDSMSNAEFIIDVKKTLGIKVADSEMAHISTFRQFLDYVETRVALKNERAG